MARLSIKSKTRYILFFIIFTLVGCDSFRPHLKVPLDSNPEVNFHVLGEYNFSIDSKGKVNWNIWSNSCPSEENIVFQFTNSEYKKTVLLGSKVFKRNLVPEKEFDRENGYKIYEIKLGGYFNSVAIGVVVNNNEKIPNELNQFVEYIDTLVKNNQQLKAGLPSISCSKRP